MWRPAQWMCPLRQTPPRVLAPDGHDRL